MCSIKCNLFLRSSGEYISISLSLPVGDVAQLDVVFDVESDLDLVAEKSPS